MSYEIIKSISFKNNEVKITSYCNNVSPKIFTSWKCESLTKILKEEGKENAIKEILKAFWGGSFQGGSTKYGRFIDFFRANNKKYKWDNLGESEQVGIDGILFSYDEFKNDLYNQFLEYQALDKKKEAFIVKINSQFILKLGRGGASTTSTQAWAQSFTATQIESIKQRFASHPLEIIKLA